MSTTALKYAINGAINHFEDLMEGRIIAEKDIDSRDPEMARKSELLLDLVIREEIHINKKVGKIRDIYDFYIRLKKQIESFEKNPHGKYLQIAVMAPAPLEFNEKEKNKTNSTKRDL